jgi:hypothetical protein
VRVFAQTAEALGIASPGRVLALEGSSVAVAEFTWGANGGDLL